MPFDEFPDGIVVADSDGRVTYANEWVRYWARAEEDEFIGMHLNEALPFDDLGGHRWFESVQPYDGLNIRTRISESSWYSPRGSEYLITASLVRERPAGKVMKVIVSIRNARVRLQRDRQRSDMVATVAHELRSPLTGIKGFTATLLSRWDAFTEEQRFFMLQTIDADADRLSRLITELLDAARIDAGRLALRTEPVRLAELAERVLTSVFSTSENPPRPRVDADVPVVWGDADRITQVLTNLVENALRHGEGLSELTVDPLDQGGVPGVAVRISDHGPGIPEETRMRVFSRFWRAGPGAGSGLGMFIVRGVVDHHGGSILIDDAEGGGARICVWFPINEPDTLTA